MRHLLACLFRPRILYPLATLCCAGLIGYALHLQYNEFLNPCPLCIFQRIAVLALGLVFLLASIHAWVVKPDSYRTAGRVWGSLSGLVALIGAGISIRHLWVQYAPSEGAANCGAGLGTWWADESLSKFQVIAMVLQGTGDCAKIDWTFLGLSIPAWTLFSFVVLGAAGVYSGWRRQAGD